MNENRYCRQKKELALYSKTSTRKTVDSRKWQKIEREREIETDLERENETCRKKEKDVERIKKEKGREEKRRGGTLYNYLHPHSPTLAPQDRWR